MTEDNVCIRAYNECMSTEFSSAVETLRTLFPNQVFDAVGVADPARTYPSCAQALEEGTRIPDLVTPTGKFNVYNIINYANPVS